MKNTKSEIKPIEIKKKRLCAKFWVKKVEMTNKIIKKISLC